MADADVTLGNDFLNSNGANTVVLSDTDMFPKTLLEANKQIWDEKKAVADQHQKQITEAAKNLDFEHADMSNADQAFAQNKIGAFRDTYSNNPNALTGKDTVANGKMLNDRGLVNFYIDKGKGDKAVYDGNIKAIQDHPALYDQQSIDDLNKWYSQPLDKRGNPPVLTTKPTFNPVLDEHNFQEAVKPVPVTVGHVNADGTHTTTTKLTVDPTKFTATANTMYNHAVQNDGLLETIRRQQVNAKAGTENNPEIPTWDSNNLFGKDGNLAPTGTVKLSDATSPFDVYMYNKQAAGKNYTSKDVTAGKENTGANGASGDNWATDYVGGLLNNNISGQYKLPLRTADAKEKLLGGDVTVYPAPSMWTDTDPDNSDKKRSVVAVVEDKNGDYYKVHDSEATPNPQNPKHYQIKDLGATLTASNKINNPWLEVILPNTTSQKERDKAALQIWTQHPDKAQEYGVPKPLGITSNTSETELSGQIDPSTLQKGSSYKVKGNSYIWNGTKLVPK